MNLKSYVRLNPYDDDDDDEKRSEEQHEEKNNKTLIVCSILGMLGVGAWVWTWGRS